LDIQPDIMEQSASSSGEFVISAVKEEECRGKRQLADEIRLQARALGFGKTAIIRAQPLDNRNGLEKWLARGNHGEMFWMARDPGKRLDPQRILAGTRSVISIAMNYYTPGTHSSRPLHGKISRYAWGKDYHLILKDRLAQLARWILEKSPNDAFVFYSDTGPVMDKAWAHLGGIGWIGKHSNLITRDLGSWVFLGEIFSTLELEYDSEDKNYCGRCRRCIDACPTGAIVEPYVVDARLCISYLTIELRGPIPRHLRPLVGSRIFGCDDCQDVCPWNRFAQPTPEKDFYHQKGLVTPILTELLQMSEESFWTRFKDSPIRRARYQGFLRNVAVALGNSHDHSAVPLLIEALHHPIQLVRQHVAWALGRTGGMAARAGLRDALEWESDEECRCEIQEALQECKINDE
jgi:epoxyqueuosine reductase